MKNIMSLILKNKILYYVMFLAICFLLYVYNLTIKLSFSEHIKVFTIFIIISVFIALLLFGSLLLFKKYSYKKIHIFFAIMAFVFGLFYIMFAPVFTGSDEHNHFYRIYELTDGQIFTPVSNNVVGGKLPKSLVNTFTEDTNALKNTHIKYYYEFDMMKIPLNKDNTIRYGIDWATKYSNTALYSPLQYIPHVIGIGIGKTFNLGPFWLIILGRLFNLLFFVIIATFGIKLLPGKKIFAMAILLSPTVMVGATTLSSDGFTYALIFLFVAYILNFIKIKQKISVGNRIILLALAILISVCKIVYLPIVTLIFLLPKECYKNNKNRWLFNIIIIIISALASLIWMNCVQNIFDNYYLFTDEQKEFIFSNLFKYFIIIIHTYGLIFNDLFNNLFIGNQLYHAQLPVYPLISFLYCLLVFLIMFIEKRNVDINKNMKIFVAFIILCLIGLITTALYLQCTANVIEDGVGYGMVFGLQGRYFIPIIFLLIFIVSKDSVIKCKKGLENILFNFIILMQFPMLLMMMVHFI